MPEENREQLGDGRDDYGFAAQQLTNAARSVADSSAAVLKAGVEGGKAVSGIAAGTAAGGPWGAVLSAAWAMRNGLFKVLVCICLVLLIFVIAIISLPSIVMNSIFGLDGNPGADGTTLLSTYNEMSGVVSEAIEAGHEAALARVEQIIANGGYDYDLSMEALIDYAQSSAGYDTCYVLAAYSASLEQRGTSKADMLRKLNSVTGSMFPVTYEVKQQSRLVPTAYYTYSPVTVRVVSGESNGTYTTTTRRLYTQSGTRTTDTPITVAAYQKVTVLLPVYNGGRVVGTRSAVYYERNGTQRVSPTTEIIKYAVCTVHPFDNTVITEAFNIDVDAKYGQFDITYGEAIQKMANALKRTLYGSLGNGAMVPLTDAELIAFVNAQNCNDTRKYILATALSLVGRVPYFWGGKSPPGWDERWNTPMLVTAAGSPSSGTIRPYGLDCSGFVTWVFETCFGINVGAGCNNQYTYTYAVSASELLPGDLGFYRQGNDWGHILIFAGYGENGQRMWVHSTNGGGCNGVVLNTPSYESTLSFRRCRLIDYDAPVPSTWTLYGGGE